MIRTCDGNDPNLKREQVDRISASGQESTKWVPCDCGTTFDDVERLTVYPHYAIPAREDKEALLKMVDQMVEQGKTSEQIREQLTLQPVVNYSQGNTPTPDRRSPMGEFDNDAVTGNESAERVSAEGTENAEAEQTAADVDADGTDENAEAEQGNTAAGQSVSDFR